MKQLFSEFLRADQILDEPGDLAAYGKDWCKSFEANPALILLPGSYEEVQAILRVCNERRISVVPSGGRTGLSGGATATANEVVLSLARLNRILEINTVDSTLTCQAGAVTEKVQSVAAEQGLYFPIDLASSGSSQVGGNVATNAGGIHVIRYGSTRHWVLGMKVVTASGDLLELNGALEKNQTGYDLRSLFIGSEGTLGIIVELVLKLARRPRSLTRALVGSQTMESILALLGDLRKRFDRLSAFEFFTSRCLQYVLKHHRLRNPFESAYPYYGVIEIEDLEEADEEILQEFLFEQLEAGKITDVVLSQNAAQAEELMALRELIGETTSTHYTVHKNDLSVPVRSVSEFLVALEEAAEREYPGFDVLLFGHVGDGNVHVNILKPESMARDEFFHYCHEHDERLFELVRTFKGSISAEHGVGLLKREFLQYSRSREEIELMRRIKLAFDPNGILNPGKIFESTSDD